MSQRTGKRRAAVLAALTPEIQTIYAITKATGLKYPAVRDILDTPSMARLIVLERWGVQLADTPEAAQAQAEARALLAEAEGVGAW